MNRNDAEDEAPIANFTAAADDANKRLDLFLAENTDGRSRTQLQRLITENNVLVNGKPAKASSRLTEGDEIEIEFTEQQAAKFEPENIPLEIVFEDEYLAVINKPAGMVVHPGAGNKTGTLANAVAFHFMSEPSALAEGHEAVRSSMDRPPAYAGGSDLPAKAGTQNADRVGIVHRLDKFTSGLIVVAKDEEIHEALSEQFRKRTVSKSYVALVHGNPRETSGIIDRPMARDRWHRTKMTVAANGRNALTMWKIRRRFEKFALIDVEIKTGRTHQIRVHLASINNPVVGDETYNEGRDNTIADTDIRNAVQTLGRFFLHAEKLSFDHPVNGERLEFMSEMPEELLTFLEKLG